MDSLEETSNSIIYFLKELSFSPHTKDLVFEERNLKAHKALFLPFFHAIAEAFPSIKEEPKKIAGAAVYLGAMAVYELDPVLDLQLKAEKSNQHITTSISLLQQAQLLLSRIFTPDSMFWDDYFRRWRLHFHELELSKVNKKTQIQWTREDYYHLLTHKYALIFTPLDICYHLTLTDRNTYTLLENTLKDFIIGYNIPNEISGFQQDGELNIANYSWCKLVPRLKEMGLQAEDYSLPELHKLLYLSGTAEEMYQESLQAFERCLKTIKKLNLGLLENLIKARKEKIRKESEMSSDYIKGIMGS